jgi:hypothetical protein
MTDLPVWMAAQREFDATVSPQGAKNLIRSALNKIPPELRSAVYGLYLHDEPGKSKFPVLKIWSDALRDAPGEKSEQKTVLFRLFD